jgi:hypothetical protein
MNSKHRNLALIGVVVLSAVVICSSIQGAGEPTAPDQEFLNGILECSESVDVPGSTGIEASLKFTGTSGILKSDVLVDSNPLHATEPVGTGELCDTLSAQVLQTVRRLGCTDGKFRTDSDSVGTGRIEARSFAFVCQGRRSLVVRTIAELSKTLLSEAP